MRALRKKATTELDVGRTPQVAHQVFIDSVLKQRKEWKSSYAKEQKDDLRQNSVIGMWRK